MVAEKQDDLFTGRVRPILARHCFKCHGPDDKARKAKLRLDFARAGPQAGGFGSRADRARKARRKRAREPHLRRGCQRADAAPAAKNPALPTQTKQIAQEMDRRGAEYKTHWAFVAPRNGPPPQVAAHEAGRATPSTRSSWPGSKPKGCKPSPSRPTGPTLIRAAVARPGRLAADARGGRRVRSRPFGRRLREAGRSVAGLAALWRALGAAMARPGPLRRHQRLREGPRRSIWPYRDWVIEALNADMPFDQFTIEQLAGDMLPGATPGQRIATGFHRNTMLNEEGGIDPLEFRFYAMTDRVATTATVWLGLTLGCAQCHTHKFDPIPHREYYQFMALLNNADEPEMTVSRPEIARQARRDRRQDRRAGRRPAEPIPAGDIRERPDSRRSGSKQRGGRGGQCTGTCSGRSRRRRICPAERAGGRVGFRQRRPEQARSLHAAILDRPEARSRRSGSRCCPTTGCPSDGPGPGLLRRARRRFLPERDHA